MLNGTKEHYRSFDESYITETTEADRPSLNLKLATTKDVKFKSVFVATKVSWDNHLHGLPETTVCLFSKVIYNRTK